jgi:hypothetical protein
MPLTVEYSLTLSEDDRTLLLLCLGMATGSAMDHDNHGMVRVIRDFTHKIAKQLGGTAYVLEIQPPAKDAGTQPPATKAEV